MLSQGRTEEESILDSCGIPVHDTANIQYNLLRQRRRSSVIGMSYDNQDLLWIKVNVATPNIGTTAG
jgi:hypothetical protein